MIRRAWRAFTRGLITEANGWATGAAIIAEEQARAQAPAPAASTPRAPAPAPAPGQGTPPQAAEPPPRPAPAPGCRWCGGTGWAVVLDHVLEDAYSIACPGGCLPTLPTDAA